MGDTQADLEGSSVFARQQDDVVGEVEADFLKRLIGEPNALGDHGLAVGVFADELGGVIGEMDLQFPELEGFAGNPFDFLVFSTNGMGSLIHEAGMNRDYPMLQRCFLLLSFAVLGVNFIVDILTGLLDPRAAA